VPEFSAIGIRRDETRREVSAESSERGGGVVMEHAAIGTQVRACCRPLVEGHATEERAVAEQQRPASFVRLSTYGRRSLIAMELGWQPIAA
jgi:hypothetical protein